MFGYRPVNFFVIACFSLWISAWAVDFNISTLIGQEVRNIPMNVGAPEPMMVQQQLWEHNILAQAYEEYMWSNYVYARGMVTGAVQDDEGLYKASSPDFWVNELLLGYHSPSMFYWEVGKMHLRQGSGFFKRPIDWFYDGWQAVQSQSRTFNEQLAQGVRALNLGYLFGLQSLQAAFVLPNDDSLYTKDGLKEWSRAALYYKLQLGNWNWTLAGVYAKVKEQRQAGLSFNNGFSPMRSWHGEWAISQEKLREFDPREKISWAQEFLLGMVWAPIEGTSITMEYAYDQAGLSKKAWRDIVKEQSPGVRADSEAELWELMRSYPEFSLVRHYIMGRFWKQFSEPQFDFEIIGAINLFDRSTMLGLGLAKVIDNFRINVGLRNFLGKENSEFGEIPIRYTVSTEFEVMC